MFAINLDSSVDPFIGGYLDHRENIKIIGVDISAQSKNSEAISA